MRWIVNENVAGMVIRSLRDRGHDVLSVKETMRGAGDPEILARAQAEERIVVTHDKDFGELAFRYGLPARSGFGRGNVGRNSG
jgi:predicted nuclease of predicted toxin-antitoxin system